MLYLSSRKFFQFFQLLASALCCWNQGAHLHALAFDIIQWQFVEWAQAFAEWKSSLSITNILSLLLQSDKKDFSAISCSVNTVLGTSKIMGENREINHLKNFNNADEIKNIGNYQKQNIDSIFRNSQMPKTRS